MSRKIKSVESTMNQFVSYQDHAVFLARYEDLLNESGVTAEFVESLLSAYHENVGALDGNAKTESLQQEVNALEEELEEITTDMGKAKNAKQRRRLSFAIEGIKSEISELQEALIAANADNPHYRYFLLTVVLPLMDILPALNLRSAKARKGGNGGSSTWFTENSAMTFSINKDCSATTKLHGVYAGQLNAHGMIIRSDHDSVKGLNSPIPDNVLVVADSNNIMQGVIKDYGDMGKGEILAHATMILDNDAPNLDTLKKVYGVIGVKFAKSISNVPTLHVGMLTSEFENVGTQADTETTPA